MNRVHIDIETYSTADLKKSGAYEYAASIDFEIILISYAVADGPINIIDVRKEGFTKEFLDLMQDSRIEKHAFNAAFERTCFRAVGIDVPINEWRCTMVRSAVYGLPLGLDKASEVLNNGESIKQKEGKTLIRFFCMPTKKGARNLPEEEPEKWEAFKEYCMNDVEAERDVYNKLTHYKIPDFETQLYFLDQKINDAGVKTDQDLIKKAIAMDSEQSKINMAKLKEITNLDNPNSPTQLKEWLSETTGNEITTLAKKSLEELIEKTEDGLAKEVMQLRQKISKTSIKKYQAMINCTGPDKRARGLFQFYGANRTGRWSGRLVQLQNLKRTELDNIEQARNVVLNHPLEEASIFYADIPDILSKLIRTALVAPAGKLLAVSDFSAIEARVIAWIANEQWRLDVFNTHGKIYEASASMMFNVPLESVTKGSDLRAKGKVSELALGYQGAVGALIQMGGEDMGLSKSEMQDIVNLWRQKNKEIVGFWYAVGDAAIFAVRTKKKVTLEKYKNLVFEVINGDLSISLPSGRKLLYHSVKLSQNKFGREAVSYAGIDPDRKIWGRVDSYGGKFVENIVQAVARDLLAHALMNLDKAGFKIIMHVHDEAVLEVESQEDLKEIYRIMSLEAPWAKGLKTPADGYLSKYYKKD